MGFEYYFIGYQLHGSNRQQVKWQVRQDHLLLLDDYCDEREIREFQGKVQGVLIRIIEGS